MKKTILAALLSSGMSLGLLLDGCSNANPAVSIPKNNPAAAYLPAEAHTLADEDTAPRQNAVCSLPLNSEATIVEQDGPYGKISLSIPGDGVMKPVPWTVKN